MRQQRGQPRDRVRDLVLDLWTKTRIDWGFATDRIAEAFRRERGLGSAERRRVAETLYGMIRQARRIDYALEPASIARADRELARYVAYRLLAGEIDAAAAGAELHGIPWHQVAAVDERIAHERPAERRLGLRHSFPDWLARRFLDQFGDEADALAAALNERAPLTVRVNTLKATREQAIDKLAAENLTARPTRFAGAGLVLETRVNLFATAACKAGLIEAQDEASQLVAELVAPPPRGLVIDACAGAGGKTLALGALMGSRGRLVALDISDRKLDELRRRARRAGLSNARAVLVEPDRWPDEIEALRGKADRVLVDAPCSGVGALRRNPEARWRLCEDDLPRLAAEQLAILRRSAPLVTPGGRLIYATCSLLADENQRVVERFLSSEKGWDLLRPAEIWGSERAFPLTSGGTPFLTMLPHRHDTDGFFAALLRKGTGSPPKTP